MNPRRAITALIGVAALLGAAVAGLASPASAASLQEVTNFGTNPSQLRMYLYVPDGVGSSAPLVVAPHYCHGDGVAFFNGSGLKSYADQYKFIMIFPSVTLAGDQCFDVASTATLTHNGGSDSLGIVSMVNYVKSHYSINSDRVFATGVSSGAMMTNVLLGAYPDVFRAGSAWAGVPFSCFAGTVSWSDDCAKGRITKTAAQWGDAVRNAYPGYSGPRPKMQLAHGTNDETLSYVNFGEEIKQWTNVLGVSATPVSTEQNTPQSGWTRTRYGSATSPVVEAISMAGVSHNLPYTASEVVHWLGLDSTTTSTTSTTTTSTTTTTTTTTRPTTTTTTTRPTTTTTTTGGGGSGACTALFSAPNPWSGGFVANVTVTASSALTGWRVTLALPSGVSVQNGWNGQFTGSTGTVQVTNMGYNGVLAAGGSTSFGFQGSGSPSGITATCAAA